MRLSAFSLPAFCTNRLRPLRERGWTAISAADYSAVDLMGHVNNTRYVEWICNCFPQEKYQQEQIAWLQINYNNEVRPNEIVQLGIQPVEIHHRQ